MNFFDQNYFPDFIGKNGGAMMTLESHVETYRAQFLLQGKRPPIVAIPQRSIKHKANVQGGPEWRYTQSNCTYSNNCSSHTSHSWD